MSKPKSAILIAIFILFINSLNIADAGVTKQKLCIIGAGPAGLATTRLFAEKSELYDVITFDKQNDIGGQWVYSDNTENDEFGLPVHSSVYKNLRANSPKHLMSYQDYIKPEGTDSGYVTHEEFQQYLKDYANHFNLHKYIRLGTLVDKVTPIIGNGDWRTTQWKVETRNVNKSSEVFVCNVVMVCNGQESTPRMPVIEGIESFPGKVLHSHTYRLPEVFAGQKVIVLGAGASGVDIAIEVSQFADTVYLSHNQPKIQIKFADNVIQVAGVISANEREFTLKDGSKIEADAIIYCTGYVRHFPFLEESSGIVVDENYVQFIYKHIVNVKYPTMGFIGLPYVVSKFPVYYSQVKFHMAFLEGKVQLPSKTEMMQDAKLKDGTAKRHAHRYNEKTMWSYDKELASIGGFEPSPSWFEKATLYMSSYIWTHFDTFREKICRIHNNGTIEVINLNQM